MKSTISLIAVLLLAFNGIAQDLTLIFNGSGAATSVDNITALNQSTSQQITVTGNTLLLKSVVNNIETTKGSTGDKVWPNPFVESANIEFTLKKSDKTTISVYNSLGQKVATSVQYLEAGKNQFVFNSKESGVYHIRVLTSEKTLYLSAICKKGSSSTANLRFVGGSDRMDIKESLQKSAKEDLYISYTPGDRILYTVTSGNNVTLISDIPDQNKTYDVPFVNCSDGDNNYYKAVQIGTQMWMAENLKTTKYNDNTSIPHVKNSTVWFNTYTPAYCYYLNDSITYRNIYGALYNWYSIDTAANGNKNVCPVGWHVPSDNDWAIMENYLIANGFNWDGTVDNDDDRNTTNKIAKSLASTTNWINEYNLTGTPGKTDFPEKRNGSGFTALPGGSIVGTHFVWVETMGQWWTSTLHDSSYPFNRYIESGGVSLYKDYSKNKWSGLSIRCVKNQ